MITGGNFNSLLEMQSTMRTQMQDNPAMVRQLMGNPIVQHFMDNPELLRTFMMSMPEIQALIERYPEVNHMLNNPAVLRQCAEIMRNPAMAQEFTRNNDRAIQNLENIPGGMQALERMYQAAQVTVENFYNILKTSKP